MQLTTRKEEGGRGEGGRGGRYLIKRYVRIKRGGTQTHMNEQDREERVKHLLKIYVRFMFLVKTK